MPKNCFHRIISYDVVFNMFTFFNFSILFEETYQYKNKRIQQTQLQYHHQRGPLATSLKVQQYQFVTKTVTIIINCTGEKSVGTILTSPQTM